MTHHLAQYNIARLTHPLTAPQSQGFVELLDEVNAAAERHPGYVWRLQTEDGDATSIDVYGDPQLIVNLSVWEDLASLRSYAYSDVHGAAFRERSEWFDARVQPMVVLWWLPAGHVPTVDEAASRLDHLRAEGPTHHAFTFSRPFSAEKDGG